MAKDLMGSVYFSKARKKWCLDFKKDGKRLTVYSDTKEGLIEKRIKSEQKKEKSDKTIYENFVKFWFENHSENLSISTKERYDGIIRNYLIPKFGKRKVVEITTMDVQEFIDKLKKKGEIAPASINYIINVMRGSFKEAIRLGLVNQSYRNPCDNIRKPKLTYQERNVWTTEEIETFLQVAKDDRFYPLFLLAVTSGMRQSEMLGLHWSDLDVEKKTIKISKALLQVKGKRSLQFKTKTLCSNRTISLPQNTIDALNTLPKVSEFIFTNTEGKPVVASNLYHRHFKPLIKKAGVSNVTFHSLRHLHATILSENMVDEKVISARLGHSSIKITKDLYTHLRKDYQEKTAEIIEEIFS